MQPSDSDAWISHDAENNRGLEDYKPLKLTAGFAVPCLYSNCDQVAVAFSEGAVHVKNWNQSLILPSVEVAPKALLQLEISSADGRNFSSITLPPFPLIGDKPMLAQTPNPQQKCRSPQHGLYVSPSSCHIAQRLEQICIAVELDSSGRWTLHDANDTGTVHKFHSKVHTGSFGCDPDENFEPAYYRLDPCWGPYPSRRACQTHGLKHYVEVVVRAWQDPSIAAATLTHSQFDFGPAKGSQQTTGVILLSIGFLIGVVPSWCCYKKQKTGSDFESELQALSPAARPSVRQMGRHNS